MSSGALEGIRVIEVGLLVQGPQAAAALGDLGADVIKVELPGMGDLARLLFVAAEDQRSAYFIACNRGKRSITLDLRTPGGAEVFKRMAARADVVLSNFKPGTMDAWGLGYEALRVLNPGIIWAAGSAFGPVGPDAAREGADLAGQAAGGLISTIGHEGDAPSPVGVTIADHIASQNLAVGVLAALHHRARSGKGQKVEVSLLGGQIWAQASEYSHYLLTGEVPGRSGHSHPLLRGLYGIFQTQDGWIGVIGVPPHSRDAFFIAMERPELSLDPRFLGMMTDREDLKLLFDELAPAFRSKTTQEWCEVFREMGVRYAPVRDYRETAQDPGAWENGYFLRAQGREGETVQMVGSPIAMSETPPAPGPLAPELGEHSDEILGELGYTAQQIAGFREKGVV